jgi:FKBP-type peptidyl-prolyl cis-trans isomerase FklB
MNRWRATHGLLVALALVGCHRQTGSKLDADPKRRESYGLGYKLGSSLRQQRTSIELDAYVAGLREAITGNASQISEAEMQAAVSSLREHAMAAQKAADEGTAAANRTSGRAFLDANRKQDGVTVLPSGLQYKVLKQGRGRSPKVGDVVVVNYRGTLVDGTEFANTYKRRKATVLTLDQVIPAWKEALPLMKEEAKWQVVAPAELAYGRRGAAPRVGPESTLVFEVELLGVRPARRQSDN